MFSNCCCCWLYFFFQQLCLGFVAIAYKEMWKYYAGWLACQVSVRFVWHVDTSKQSIFTDLPAGFNRQTQRSGFIEAKKKKKIGLTDEDIKQNVFQTNK